MTVLKFNIETNSTRSYQIICHHLHTDNSLTVKLNEHI